MVERVRTELFQAVENERDIAQSELRQLGERVNAIVQMVNGERNKREISQQGAEKQVQGMRDMIDGERQNRRQELAVHLSMLQGCKQQIEGEKCAREASEDRHTFDVHTLNERIDQLSSHHTELQQDHDLSLKKVAEEQ